MVVTMTEHAGTPDPMANRPSSEPTPERVRVAIVLLTMNQVEITLRCLESLRQVGSPSHSVVLWDNGSTDGTGDAVAKRFPAVTYLPSEANVGVASGRNRASAHAIQRFDPEFLFFMDNDMTVTPGFLRALVDPFGADPSLGITTGKIRDMSDPSRLYGAGGNRLRFWAGDTRHVGFGELDRGQYDRPLRCVASGGCMLVRTSLFQHLGGFDQVFDPYGPEDLDFGLRAQKAGFYALYVPEAVVFHESRPGRTLDGGAYSESFARLRARHWMRFLRRHASPWQKLGFYFVGAPFRLARVAIREGRRGNLRKALSGLIRGAASARD